mmetsp:Transcript_3078/g.5232  ORF Transcript_3078/g.5232 Transcript_3078/m.5232 type:complete len:369 (-) Transcript_3078:312-1418(-)
MGCGSSVGKPAEPENEAEALLKQAEADEKFRLKVLLLGAGESGKSTVVKQIKLIGNVHETEDDKAKYRSALRRNVIEAMQVLLQASDTLGIEIEDESLREEKPKILALENDNSSAEFPPELAITIDKLWKDPGIQTVYSRRSEYWIMDATPYYLDEVYRIASTDFDVTEEDIIMARVRTIGIVISDVHENPYTFQIVDVGGQRSERRKWIHCFDNVNAIIYLASLSGYNQVLFEDNSENIMNESIKLFEEVMKNPVFKETPIFVFLNKKDLFGELIKTNPLTKCFKDYDGPEGEMDPALTFIKGKFQHVVEEHCPGKNIHFHIVAARVRMDMKVAFGEVKQILKKLHPVRKATMLRPAEQASRRISSK